LYWGCIDVVLGLDEGLNWGYMSEVKGGRIKIFWV